MNTIIASSALAQAPFATPVRLSCPARRTKTTTKTMATTSSITMNLVIFSSNGSIRSSIGLKADMDRGDRLGTGPQLGDLPLPPQKTRQLEIFRILHVADQVLRRQRIMPVASGVPGIAVIREG